MKQEHITFMVFNEVPEEIHYLVVAGDHSRFEDCYINSVNDDVDDDLLSELAALVYDTGGRIRADIDKGMEAFFQIFTETIMSMGVRYERDKVEVVMHVIECGCIC